MIQRVYEQAKKSSMLDEVAVATDDQRIFDHVKSFSGNVVKTSTSHSSGTDRCYEAYLKLCQNNEAKNWEAIINIQGDEPFIDPGQIDKVAACLAVQNSEIVTLALPLSNADDLNDPNNVKVVINQQGKALYFSRLPIPYSKNGDASSGLHFKHIGIYGFRSDIFKEVVKLPVSELEISESLEQLRWLDHGYRINVELTDTESIAIDTPEDLQKIVNKF